MPDISLAGIESFYVGGQCKPFRNHVGEDDESVVGAMYVQRLCPAQCSLPVPAIMIHGGCHTGVTWETTPDGREGWAVLFARAGIDVYVVDQPWRGRSAVELAEPIEREPGHRPHQAGLSAIEMFARGGQRFSEQARKSYGAQLALDYGVGGAIARGHPGFSDPRALPPLVELLDRTGPAILVTHSQSGDIGWKAAIARPDKVAAILAIEPGITSPGLDDPDFPAIPVRILWGDNLPEDGVVLTQRDVDVARAIAAKNPLVSVDHLPAEGITGNGHMLMMEDNSAELAERAVRWMREAVGGQQRISEQAE